MNFSIQIDKIIYNYEQLEKYMKIFSLFKFVSKWNNKSLLTLHPSDTEYSIILFDILSKRNTEHNNLDFIRMHENCSYFGLEIALLSIINIEKFTNESLTKFKDLSLINDTDYIFLECYGLVSSTKYTKLCEDNNYDIIKCLQNTNKYIELDMLK